jgi:uncharacterized protein
MRIGPSRDICKSALVALFLSASLAGSGARAGANEALPTSDLEIHLANGKVLSLSVEVAATPQARQTGLMNRKSMADDHGMLFVFPKPNPVQMWMKDTLLPLDMLFISGAGANGGQIISIKHDAKPMDLSIIDSGGDVSYVLELNGGYADKAGIAEGDRLSGKALRIPAVK